MAIVAEKTKEGSVKLNSRDVEYALSRTVYNFRRWLMVPNVSWGMMPWECDILAMSGSGYLHEIEIKVCPNDLRNDAKKEKWRFGWRHGNMLRGFYFAAPDYVWEKTGFDVVPPDVGILVVAPGANAISRWVFQQRPCKINKNAVQLSDAQRFQLARLGAMRYWTRMKDCRGKQLI